MRAVERMEANAGHLVAEVLSRNGVRVVYTLSGGHIFPIYDGCVRRGIRLLDCRHEQTAAFAAEGHAKLTRGAGVAVVTAGPGVTNSVSAVASARFNGSPLVVLAGRAPQSRWGAGSLQELDHVPVMAPLTKHAQTVADASQAALAVDAALRTALSPHRGPVFVDFPLDALFVPVEAELPPPVSPPRGSEPDPEAVRAAASLLEEAERPVVVGGTDVWMDGAWEALGRLVEELVLPCLTNGMGRGCLPADHPLAFSRARALALREADLVVVVGTPLDFRLGFGHFGGARVIHVQDAEAGIGRHAAPAAAVWGDLTSCLDAIRAGVRSRRDRGGWVERLRGEEAARREAERAELESEAWPIHPARVYGELRRRLERDAVVVGDGGDFVSYAGRLIDSYLPGAWLDPGPYGCLGCGLGYAIAARVVHPSRQVVLLLGDGAFGFSGLDFDTLVRHRLPVVAVVGNNGIWGLEKHPMRSLYGYDVAADLRQETRYDQVVAALGGAGETVEKAEELGPALDRAFASGVPYVVNVLTDPAVAYPRSSNLA